jgi:cell division protein FtsX
MAKQYQNLAFRILNISYRCYWLAIPLLISSGWLGGLLHTFMTVVGESAIDYPHHEGS